MDDGPLPGPDPVLGHPQAEGVTGLLACALTGCGAGGVSVAEVMVEAGQLDGAGLEDGNGFGHGARVAPACRGGAFIVEPQVDGREAENGHGAAVCPGRVRGRAARLCGQMWP